MSHVTPALLACACLFVGGCNTLTPTSPLKTEALSAQQTVYTGTIVDSTKGTGTLVVSLSSGGGFTGGTWMMTFNGKLDPITLVSGTVSGNTYTATVTQCVENGVSGCSPNCALAFTGSLTATEISGTYTDAPRPLCPGRAGTADGTH